jgi:lipoate-protein ligase B
VWTDAGKIAAMGVHISRWVTRHGFALNINTDLTFFDMIVPCGISGKKVTSMQKLAQRIFDMKILADRYVAEFGNVFRRQMIAVEEYTLHQELRQFRIGSEATVG